MDGWMDCLKAQIFPFKVEPTARRHLTFVSLDRQGNMVYYCTVLRGYLTAACTLAYNRLATRRWFWFSLQAWMSLLHCEELKICYLAHVHSRNHGNRDG